MEGWISEQEYERQAKEQRKCWAQGLMTAHEALLCRGEAGEFRGRVFTAQDGREYDLTLTLRCCRRELKQAAAIGSNFDSAIRDLRLVRDFLADG